MDIGFLSPGGGGVWDDLQRESSLFSFFDGVENGIGDEESEA